MVWGECRSVGSEALPRIFFLNLKLKFVYFVTFWQNEGRQYIIKAMTGTAVGGARARSSPLLVLEPPTYIRKSEKNSAIGCFFSLVCFHWVLSCCLRAAVGTSHFLLSAKYFRSLIAHALSLWILSTNAV